MNGGWRHVLRRYCDAFSRAWAIRHRDAASFRKRDESDFLPAVLEIQESPPNPLARITAYMIIAFFVVALAWMAIGKTDIVATAPGKIIPDERIKVVQAPEGGIVQKILVADGDRVREGDTLFLLDETANAADMSIVEENFAAAVLEEEMARILSASPELDAPQITVAGISAARTARQQRVLENLHGEQQERVAKLKSDIDALLHKKRGEERSIADARENMKQYGRTAREREEGEILQAKKTEDLLPLAKKEYDSMRELADKGAVPELRTLQAREKYISLQADLSYRRNSIETIRAEREARETELRQTVERHRNNVLELDANLRALRDSLSLLRSSFRREMSEKREEAAQRAAQYRQELIKIKEAQKRRRIVAPVGGVVQQMALHTENGVVQPAQALLVIVPENPVLEIEALIENKDIGFVRENQAAEIKIDAFPYTKYGLVHGEVKHLSADAIEDQQRGLVYQARIRLHDDKIVADGRAVSLSPGMSAVVEIKTGKRRIMEFFLSPLLRYGRESLGER